VVHYAERWAGPETHVHALYGFTRYTGDLVDESTDNQATARRSPPR
jgi:hypothetical protein